MSALTAVVYVQWRRAGGWLSTVAMNNGNKCNLGSGYDSPKGNVPIGGISTSSSPTSLMNKENKFRDGAYSASGERGVQQQKAGSQINSTRYKTELCRPFEENGSCKYGEKCQFAHSYHELRSLSRHPKYKTEPCRTFHTIGFCPYGPRCHFIHNADERRPAPAANMQPGEPRSTRELGGYSQRDRPKLHHSLSFSGFSTHHGLESPLLGSPTSRTPPPPHTGSSCAPSFYDEVLSPNSMSCINSASDIPVMITTSVIFPDQHDISTMISRRRTRPPRRLRTRTLRCLLQIQDIFPPLNTCTVNQNISTFVSDPQEFRNRKGVGFLHLNIRSLLSRHKLDHINILVNQANPDILVISETWLHKDIDDQTVFIQGYNIFRSDRASRGGGVAVYVKSTYSAAILNAVSIPKCFDFISLKIDLGHKNSIIVIGVYRPPCAPTMALKKMAELLIPLSDSELIVLGDFNLDWSTDASEALKELSSDLHFTQLISVPTRPNLKDFSKSTLIDLIFCNKPEKYVANGVLDLGISDHCPIICIRDMRLQKCGSWVVMKRNFKLFDEQASYTTFFTAT
ncbi:uncharacterized protein LOC133020696 [Limanda limanda]|uniref:uncharacterized protein LOC133020696 n=1 Tax=Limanda limanda TaxID=27771 RepID=UPI0029C7F24F|nr:uncharacterized protein LOC133020696 [Limanda limanda]